MPLQQMTLKMIAEEKMLKLRNSSDNVLISEAELYFQYFWYWSYFLFALNILKAVNYLTVCMSEKENQVMRIFWKTNYKFSFLLSSRGQRNCRAPLSYLTEQLFNCKLEGLEQIFDIQVHRHLDASAAGYFR